MKYRKKPVVIEAFQMTRECRYKYDDWPEWLIYAWNLDRSEVGSVIGLINGKVSINTLEGILVVSFGDYIIRGIQGEIYPCKEDIFLATYEPVEDAKGVDHVQLER